MPLYFQLHNEHIMEMFNLSSDHSHKINDVSGTDTTNIFVKPIVCTDHPATSKGKITIIGRNSTSNIENETEQRKGKFLCIYRV